MINGSYFNGRMMFYIYDYGESYILLVKIRFEDCLETIHEFHADVPLCRRRVSQIRRRFKTYLRVEKKLNEQIVKF